MASHLLLPNQHHDNILTDYLSLAHTNYSVFIHIFCYRKTFFLQEKEKKGKELCS